MLCTVSAHAGLYSKTENKPKVLVEATTPAPLAQLPGSTLKESRSLAWLSPLLSATTLQLTMSGLAPFGFGDSAAFETAVGAPFARAAVSAPTEAPADELADEPAASVQDWITTASIPAATRPAGAQLRDDIRQDLPLFGAHRIRFGKIKSGVRVSGLIRKAATSGSSAICINQCADLADSLNLKGSDISAQLRHVSASVNKLVAYRTDEQNHGRLDYWSTPNETLSRSSGDCEDYAILKMALLSRLGVPMNAMEIVVVKDTSRRLFHAVLSVALEGKSVILDNMTDAVETDTAKLSYAPLFSISGSANYIFGYKGGKSNLLASVGNISAIAPGAGF